MKAFGLLPLFLCFPLLADDDTLNALPIQLRQGPNHETVSVVPEGQQNSYHIESNFGSFAATGLIELRKRVREIDALAYLETLSKRELLVDSTKKAGKSAVKSLFGALKKPVETAKGIPKGVEKVVDEYSKTAEKSVNSVKRFVTNTEQTPEEFKRSNYLLSKAERKWALDLSTDPYTTNHVLRAAISKMTMIEFIGELPVEFAIPAIPSIAIGVLENIGDDVYLKDAEELEASNRACLDGANIEPETIDQFFEALYLTPTMQTVFCSSATKMSGVDNLTDLASLIAQSDSFERSRFLLGTASMTAWHHSNQEALTNIHILYDQIYAQTDDGVVIVLPADHLYWTDSFASLIKKLTEFAVQEKLEQRSIWILGEASEEARVTMLQKRWLVYDRHNEPRLQRFYASGLITDPQD